MPTPRVTDLASRAETPAEIRYQFSSHPAVTSRGRLAELLALRAELDAAIERVRAAEELQAEQARTAYELERRTRAAAVLAEVAAAYVVDVNELHGPSREALVVEARHVAWWLLRRQGWSYAELGELTGGRHHTTVLHGVRRVEASAELRAIATRFSACHAEGHQRHQGHEGQQVAA